MSSGRVFVFLLWRYSLPAGSSTPPVLAQSDDCPIESSKYSSGFLLNQRVNADLEPPVLIGTNNSINGNGQLPTMYMLRLLPANRTIRIQYL
jgi:hypothetical protein